MKAVTRRLGRERAGFRCEYCRTHEDDEGYAFHLEHIIAKKHIGADELDNLAWSRQSCNLAKGVNQAGRVNGDIVAIFNPRRQSWHRHFRWNGPNLIGKTKCGRATVQVLNINHEDRVNLRTTLVAAGLFPP